MIRFDANVPPLPGVPQVPVGESFARLNEYPEGTYRELREAAAVYVGVDAAQIVPGAGADGLIALAARTFLGPGSRACVTRPTYPLYGIASAIEGAEVTAEPGRRRPDLGLQPEQPDRRARRSGADRCACARSHPDAAVVVDEAYVEYGGGAGVVPLIERAPNLVAIRTLSKAFGLAALRVGYAVASPKVARELDRRRDPAPVSAPAARIAAAALRDPRLDVEQTVAERERMRRSLAAAGFDVPESNANFVLVRTDPAVADRLDAQGLVVRRFADAVRISVRLPAENDLILAALGRRARAGVRPLRSRPPHDGRDRPSCVGRSRRSRTRSGRHRRSASSTTC